MSISAVGGSSYPQLTLPTAATKPADTDAPAPAASAPANSNSSSSLAPAAKESASGDQDKDASSSSSSSSNNLVKINPDGTVGPLHHHRHANSPGVVHA